MQEQKVNISGWRVFPGMQPGSLAISSIFYFNFRFPAPAVLLLISKTNPIALLPLYTFNGSLFNVYSEIIFLHIVHWHSLK